MHFDFKFNGSTGPGLFREGGLYVKTEVNFTNKDGKLQVEVDRIELDEGVIKVELGGSVEDRVLSTLVNIITKYASPFFYSSIKDAIRAEIKSINENVKTEVTYLDVMIDLSLLETPSFNSTSLTFRHNGASFLKG